MLATLEGHTASVDCCDVYIDREVGRRSRYRYVVWLCSMRKLSKPRFFPSRVRKLVFDLLNENNAYRVISGGQHGAIKIWNLVDNRLMHTMEGHTTDVTCVAVFADGTRAISGSSDMTLMGLMGWDLTDGTLIRTLFGHVGALRCCTVFANGTRAISGSLDETLKVWNLADGSLRPPFLAATGLSWTFGCCFDANSRKVSGLWRLMKVAKWWASFIRCPGSDAIS